MRKVKVEERFGGAQVMLHRMKATRRKRRGARRRKRKRKRKRKGARMSTKREKSVGATWRKEGGCRV